MRKNIIILSHNYHTFLLNEIKYASEVFENVVVVTRYDKQIMEKFENVSNVKLVMFDNNKLKRNIFCSSLNIFRKDVLAELLIAKQVKLLSKNYLKVLLLYLGIESILNSVVKKYDISNNPNDWVILSSWYSASAFAASRIKEKYPNIKAVSLAHSYEIDKKKNKYLDVLFRYNYHKYIDLTSFISKNVLEQFFNEFEKKFELDKKKFEVRYLGTSKNYSDINNNICPDDEITIVSCSYVVPVKRLELILQAISLIKNYKIKWYHIGDGPLLQGLKSMASKMEDENHCVRFIGSKTNKEVHKFLLDSCIDLFLNTSSSEGIPVTIMEALAYGIPVIATDVGGNSEIVSENVGFLLSENPSPEEIAKSIVCLKELSKLKKDVLRKNAVEVYDNLFNSDKTRVNFYKFLSND